VTAVSTFAAVAFVFTDTAFNTDASILAASTGTLTVTALLALAATLAARLGRQVLLIRTELVLEVD
jgi:hypothetical protein